VVLKYGAPEIFENVGKQQHVGEEIVIVILSQVLDVVEIPDLVGALVVLNGERFVEQSIVKVFDGR